MGLHRRPASIAIVLLVCLWRSMAAWCQIPDKCANLVHLHLKDARVVAAVVVKGSSFNPPAGSLGPFMPGMSWPLENLPDFCRVSAVVSPAVHFELWLPLESWNGRFLGTGNPAYAGGVMYERLAEGLRKRYATASTDMGHVSDISSTDWALGHFERIVDQGYRAQHVTAVQSKKIVRAFYRSAPRRSYFEGCSSGGWQGLTEAQRYPLDYDGIIAGAPAINVVHLHAAAIWNRRAIDEIRPEMFRLVTDAVLARCDAQDGVKDGLLSNPRACHFAPDDLACKSGSDTHSRLTQSEVAAFHKIYGGLRRLSGELIYPGWPHGGEYALPELPAVVADFAAGTFQNLAFQEAYRDYRIIDFIRDVPRADSKIGSIVNSNSPDLRKFRDAGGKLILYHGWNDPGISPLSSIAYFERVAASTSAPKVGKEAALAQVQGFARLFLLPGVEHCIGGPGPDTFDALAALEKWVEEGVAPAQISASHSINGVVDRTRPLCRYPQWARFRGAGSIDDAANFSCQ